MSYAACSLDQSSDMRAAGRSSPWTSLRCYPGSDGTSLEFGIYRLGAPTYVRRDVPVKVDAYVCDVAQVFAARS